MKGRIIPLVRKETLHILRDPRSLYLALGMPLILLVLFGFAVTLDVKNVPVGVVDQDNSSLSRDLISRFISNPTFELRHYSLAYSPIDQLLNQEKVKIILAIPPSFSQRISHNQNVPVQLLVDGSDNNTALIALGYASKIVQHFSTQLLRKKLKSQGSTNGEVVLPVEAQPRVWFNPDLNSTHFIVPGLIAVVMMVISAMMTSLTLAREWETGTMEQLMVTPARTHEIILGKLIPYYFLGLAQMIMVTLTGILLFRVPFRGSVIFLFLAATLFLICGLGIGLFISTVTRSQQLAFMISMLVTLLPSFLLSGFVFPISSMPQIIQLFTYLVPARYIMVVLRGIFLKGVGLGILWPQVLALFIFASAIILGCAKRMRLQLE